MYRRTIVAAAVASAVFAAPTVGAQEHRGVSFVAKGGLVASDFAATSVVSGVGTGGVDSFGRTSVGAGIAARFPLDGKWALQLEALWLHKLSDQLLELEPFPGFGPGFELVGVSVDDLEVPLLVRYEFGVGRSRPYVFGGPGMVFRFASGLSGRRFDELVGHGLLVPELAQDVNRMDVTVGVGAGVDFTIDRHAGWSFELRHTWGLRPLFGEIVHAPVPTQAGGHARAFVAFLGYRF